MSTPTSTLAQPPEADLQFSEIGSRPASLPLVVQVLRGRFDDPETVGWTGFLGVVLPAFFLPTPLPLDWMKSIALECASAVEATFPMLASRGRCEIYWMIGDNGNIVACIKWNCNKIESSTTRRRVRRLSFKVRSNMIPLSPELQLSM